MTFARRFQKRYCQNPGRKAEVLETGQIIGILSVVYACGFFVSIFIAANAGKKDSVIFGYALFWPLALVVMVAVCFVAFVNDLVSKIW